MKNPIAKALVYGFLPASVVAILFGTFLGHRNDYLGHYAAGFGGSFAAIMLVLAMLPRGQFLQWATWVVLPVCLACILLGAFAEATVFRIAKFDEVDFCNQSLGAVLAGLQALAIAGVEKPPDAVFRLSYLISIGFLILGFEFALH